MEFSLSKIYLIDDSEDAKYCKHKLHSDSKSICQKYFPSNHYDEYSSFIDSSLFTIVISDIIYNDMKSETFDFNHRTYHNLRFYLMALVREAMINKGSPTSLSIVNFSCMPVLIEYPGLNISTLFIGNIVSTTG